MRTKRHLVIVCSTLLVVLIICLALYFYFSPITSVYKKPSPDGSHKAKLIRTDSGIDINFEVLVDGKQVFVSPDFVPLKHDYREQINWDTTGKVVVLEVAGQRLFGYDAEQRRKLSHNELLAISYVPFERIGYTESLPGSLAPANAK